MIKIENLTKIYKSKSRDVEALVDINIDLPDTGLVFLIGPSGAGKSTFLKLLTCQIQPSSGKILFNGTNLSDLSSSQVLNYRRNYIGLVNQTNNLIEDLTVRENIELACSIISVKLDNNFYKEYSHILEESLIDEKVSNLSIGQQQRVSILRSICANPKVLILDEPTASLDPINTTKIFELVKQESKKRLVIVVSHNVEEVYRQQEGRIIELSNGKIVKDSSPIKLEETINSIKIDKSKSWNLSIKQTFNLGLKVLKGSIKRFIFTLLALSLTLATCFLATTFSFSKNSQTINDVLEKYKISNLNLIPYSDFAFKSDEVGGILETTNSYLPYLANIKSKSEFIPSVYYSNSNISSYIVEYDKDTLLNEYNYPIYQKDELYTNEVLISYKIAIKLFDLDTTKSIEENVNYIFSNYDSSSLQLVFKYSYYGTNDKIENVVSKYSIVGIIDTKPAKESCEDISNYQERYSIDNGIFVSKADFAFFQNQFTTSNKFYIASGYFLPANSESINSKFIDYIVDNHLVFTLMFPFSSYILNYLYFIDSINLIIVGLCLILGVSFICLFISLYKAIAETYNQLIVVLANMGISRLDLFKIFFIQSLICPLLAIVFGISIYLILISCLNSYFISITNIPINVTFLNFNYLYVSLISIVIVVIALLLSYLLLYLYTLKKKGSSN